MLCLLHFMLAAQPREWVSTKQYGGANAPTSISTDREGNVYIAGIFRSHGWKGGSKGCIVSKYCSLGQLYWTDTVTQAISIKASADENGNVYVTGLFNGSISMNGKSAKADGYCSFIAKYDTLGKCAWIKALPRIAPEDIAAISGGGFYITGKAWKDSTIRFDEYELKGKAFFIAQYDEQGKCSWVKDAAWGSYSDNEISLATDAEGNAYAAGAGRPAQGAKGFTTAYDKNGNALWLTALSLIPRDIAVDKAGNAFITGYHTGNVTFDTTVYSTCYDCRLSFLMKLDRTGDKVWTKVIEGDHVTVSSIAANDAGDVYATGSFYGNVTMNGNVLASAAYGSQNMQMMTMKLDPSGNMDWMRVSRPGESSNAACSGSAICISSTQQVHIAGQAEGAAIFDDMQIESNASSLMVMRINDAPAHKQGMQLVQDDHSNVKIITTEQKLYDTGKTGEVIIKQVSDQ
jgi:hypothetical protein